MYNRFDYSKRKDLEEYITKTVTITGIAKIMGVSRSTIYTELKKGLEDGETDIMRYSADLAQQREEEKLIRKLRGENDGK